MNLKSHFTFTKQQRNGIFLLIVIIVALQCVYYVFSIPKEESDVSNEELLVFSKEIDSLRAVKIENDKPKIYPFNPNYITDYRGSVLGMSNKEIDRLLNYRKQDKWINSAEQFQAVTGVSDSLLITIKPYFKFPEWVGQQKTVASTKKYQYKDKPKTFAQKEDLNTVSVAQLQMVNGVGEVLSERIIKFRNTFDGGFIADIQLQDVYGLSPEVITRITNYFTVKTPRQIQTIKLNSATVNELVTIQHIDYDLAYNIIEQRKLREGFKSLDELIKVKGFPVNKLDIIKLYLSLE
ncbi:MAG: ComEA family DNA-binding protein [Aestuariibaculum sp.]